MAIEVLERPPLKRVSWGALFAGFFIGFGVWFLLLTLIAAIGLSSFNARDLGSWATLGEGFGIWGGIAGIISVFVGAWCASSLSTSTTRNESVLHGVTVWGFMLVVSIWAAAMAVSAAATGAASIAGGAVTAATRAGASAVDTDTAATALNDWLRSQGKPTVAPGQLKAALNDISTQAMRRVEESHGPLSDRISRALDRGLIVGALARHTSMSRGDANDLAAQVQRQLNSAIGSAETTAVKVGQAAASAGRTAAWGAFLESVLTLIAAIIGGAIGQPDRSRLAPRPAEQVPPGRPLTSQHA